MSKVRHSASAESDLLEAWLYVAEDGVEAADRLLDQIESETRTLLMQPKMGRARDELAAGLRSWPTSTPYVLFYFVEDDGIAVAAFCTTPGMCPRSGTGQGTEDLG